MLRQTITLLVAYILGLPLGCEVYHAHMRRILKWFTRMTNTLEVIKPLAEISRMNPSARLMPGARAAKTRD